MIQKTTHPDIVLLDSITDATPEMIGKIGVSGSHGGLFAAAVASRAGLRGVVLNDAGLGFENAGIAGLLALDAVGMAGVGVAASSAEIGSANETLGCGIVSYLNDTAKALGLQLGQPISQQIDQLCTAKSPRAMVDPVEESQFTRVFNTNEVLCFDSASLITPDHAGRLIVTGSHGGLIGADPARACKAEARFVAFNNAGGGKNGAGITRLPALDQRGIAAVALDHMSCKIGDAHSAIENGVIAAANDTAKRLGVQTDRSLQQTLSAL